MSVPNIHDTVKIHPSAIVHPNAKLAKGVEVGPFTRIEENVEINENTKISSSCVIEGWTTIGKNNRIFSGAVIGTIPQDLKYKEGTKSFTIIGDNNILREYITVNPGTDEGTKTIIGSNNEFMAYVHIAHDCVVGSNVIIANLGTLAGYVSVEDRVIIGGLSAVHQFVKLGYFSIIGGCSKVTQDVVPYSMVDGHPAKMHGMNNVGLMRAGVSQENRMAVKKAIKYLLKRDMSLPNVISSIQGEFECMSEEVKRIVDFLKETKRGIAR